MNGGIVALRLCGIIYVSRRSGQIVPYFFDGNAVNLCWLFQLFLCKKARSLLGMSFSMKKFQFIINAK
jgi:hypothetical protein